MSRVEASPESTSYAPDADVIGAIRLAVEGSTDARTLRKVLVALLDHAAPTTGAATSSVWLLIEAAKAVKGRFVVNEELPKGAVRRDR